MRSSFTEEEKKFIAQRFAEGESASGLIKEYGIARSTLYCWLEKYKPIEENVENEEEIVIEKISKKEYTQLKRTVERQAKMIEILKTVNCTVKSTLKERMDELEKLLGKYNIHLLCDSLEVDRGSFYNHIKRNKRDNNAYQHRREYLRTEIKRIYEESNQIFGAKKITSVMREAGERVSDKIVHELMQEMNIKSIRTNSKSEYIKDKRKQNILKQEFSVDKPNQVWSSDVTVYNYNDKWYYICVILDLFSRKVIAYNISKNNSTQLTKSTVRKALENRGNVEGITFHSDNGSNYISKSFENYLISKHIIHSYSRPHNPHDNAVTESFFSSMKREELYRRKFKSEAEFLKTVSEYIDFYNAERPHATINYKTPEKFEEEYYEKDIEKCCSDSPE